MYISIINKKVFVMFFLICRKIDSLTKIIYLIISVILLIKFLYTHTHIMRRNYHENRR